MDTPNTLRPSDAHGGRGHPAKALAVCPRVCEIWRSSRRAAGTNGFTFAVPDPRLLRTCLAVLHMCLYVLLCTNSMKHVFSIGFIYFIFIIMYTCVYVCVYMD